MLPVNLPVTMSLSHEQRYLLEELREYLQRVEKMISRYDIDLDNFATDYSGNGYKPAKTPTLPDGAYKRREIFTRAQHQTTWIPEED